MLFTVPYQRPVRFDSAGALCECLYELQGLLAKSDNDFNDDDFDLLFGPLLRGGTYVQRVYFLPITLEYMRRNPEKTYGLDTGVAEFMADFSADLACDGHTGACHAAIRDCVDWWTSTFRVVHLDREAMRAQGSDRDYVLRRGPEHLPASRVLNVAKWAQGIVKPWRHDRCGSRGIARIDATVCMVCRIRADVLDTASRARRYIASRCPSPARNPCPHRRSKRRVIFRFHRVHVLARYSKGACVLEGINAGKIRRG